MVRFEELKTWDTMQATRRQLQTYIYLLIIMCGAVCIFFCVDYSVEFTSRQNLSWVYNMISVVLYGEVLVYSFSCVTC